VNLYYAAPTEAVREQAKKMRPPLWKTSLGPASIEEMQQLSPELLLIGLRRIDASLTNLDYLLVHIKTGQILWRFVREETGNYRIVLATEELILFRRDHGGRGSLTALDAVKGEVRWSRSCDGTSPLFLSFPGENLIVSVERAEGTVRFAAQELKNGKTVWSKDVRVNDAHRLPSPVVSGEDLLHFYGGVERIAARDGRTVWRRDDLRSGTTSPPAQLAGGSLMLIDSVPALHVLDAATGKEQLTARLDPAIGYTNIFPTGDSVYLRGAAREKGADTFTLVSVRRSDGKPNWSYADTEPSVSELLRKDDRVYLGTPSALVALNAASGKRLFKAVAATTGRTFPVHIRSVRGKIVYIGELVIAAYDPATGKELYSIGITPILDFDGLDLLIKKGEVQLSARKGAPQNFSWADRYSQEAAQYQNLASERYRLASQRFAQGRQAESKTAYVQAQVYNASSKASSQMAFYSAMDELADAMNEAFKTAELEGTLAMNRFLRQTILAAYDAAEEGDYVFRPETKDNFTGITVIHLPTGAHRHFNLSPSYQEYGLWNIVDFQKGIVYHHGIGMEPADYVFAEPFTSYRGLTKVRQFNSNLIAQQVDLPR
jgi:hypothetical protein